MYIDLLEVLTLKGPLKLTHIMYKSNVNCKVLKSQLEFLIKNGLVEERILKKEKVFFTITPKGMSTLKAFIQIKQICPIEEDNAKQSTVSLLNTLFFYL